MGTNWKWKLTTENSLTDKQVASEEAYTPTDSELPSNYRKGDDGKIFVERNGATVFTGRYVTVKDKNNKVLGKALKITNPLNNKTEYLLDTYTEYDTQEWSRYI